MKAKKATLYFNPRCGTCQKALALLGQKGYVVTVVEYLKDPPSEAEIGSIVSRLGVEPQTIVREKEGVFQERFKNKTLSRTQWIKALHEYPILMQRPIVVIGTQAVVARPVEALERWLEQI